jgi:nitroimidazol reductase NimA-like FMN-containing flavoprotein (pyridoxamine 5'-phosphate oxidase superfamily)
MSAGSLAAAARAIIDTNLYLTLGTTGSDGHPWVSPVYYAASGYREFYWTSSPDAAHSGNITRRPQVSLVIFDSQQPPYSGHAVYMTGVAQELTDQPGIDRGLAVYPRPAEREQPPMTAVGLLPPARYRLYRATISQAWVPCPRDDPAQPCAVHGRAVDHRISVTL